MAKEYNKRINNNRKNNPTLIDLKAFVKARLQLTYYAINKTMAKWRAIKDFTNAINSSNKDPFKFDKAIRYLYKCKLPLYFRLLYKH